MVCFFNRKIDFHTFSKKLVFSTRKLHFSHFFSKEVVFFKTDK
eukprot:UN10779